MKIDDIYDKSEAFINKWESQIKAAIAKFMLQKLTVEDNKIVATSGNWVVLSQIDATGDELEVKKFIEDNLKDIIEGTVSRFKQYDKTVADDLLIEGFLERYNSEDNKVLSKYYTSVRNNTLKMIIEGKTLDEIKEYVESTNIGYKQFAENTFARYERTASDVLRKRIGLKHAVYEGGTITTTRPFCSERDGKVFSEEEIESWNTLDWEGKSSPYNPFTDCGGYNCRHRLNWISEDLAKFLRDD